MFTLPDLPYAYNALEPYIDEATMRIHHDKHHAAYVANLNDVLAGEEKLLNMEVEEILKNLTRVPENIRTKVKNHGGGHANHTLFWQIMGSPMESEPTGQFMTAINNIFGSLMGLQEKLTTLAMSRFGSGWAWLVLDPAASASSGLTLMDTANQDSPLLERKIPLLTVDVWEHAYYLKYQNRRADYLKAWWNVVNWQEVEKRFLQATR